MNLPLHTGVLGALETGLIALLVGLLAYAAWHRLAAAMQWPAGVALGWACVTAVLASIGIDAWNLFYLGIMRLESPLYARIALQGIHDPASLGARVVCGLVGSLMGVAFGWNLFSRKTRTTPRDADAETRPSSE
jgi:hypothetical protein